MLDKSIKTPDRVAGNSVMKKVLLGTIVGCLVATLLAVGGVAILISHLMTSSAGGGSGGVGAFIVAIAIFILCLPVGIIWGVISAVKGWWPFYKGSFSAVKGWWPFRKKAHNQ